MFLVGAGEGIGLCYFVKLVRIRVVSRIRFHFFHKLFWGNIS